MIAIGAKSCLKYSHFRGFSWVFGHKMAIIGPFGLNICLTINLDLNDVKNKNKFCICKIVAKILNIWPKIGQVPLGRKDFQWE